MSRTGKKPIAVPSGVTANIDGGQISVKGPKGTLSIPMASEINYELADGVITVTPANETKRARSFWGMQRTLIQNLITGVTEGFSKTLQITGVGYRANVQGKNLDRKSVV
jgi:large subunit ribosomal protein L6